MRHHAWFGYSQPASWEVLRVSQAVGGTGRHLEDLERNALIHLPVMFPGQVCLLGTLPKG